MTFKAALTYTLSGLREDTVSLFALLWLVEEPRDPKQSMLPPPSLELLVTKVTVHTAHVHYFAKKLAKINTRPEIIIL